MGNDQPRNMKKATKGQIDMACLKAKLHLELARDRKNQEIIKGEKELVNKVKSHSRNKVEEILIAERVVNGLKYAQACNLLMSCAATLRSHAMFVAENQANSEKIEPWLPLIYSLIYGSDQLGLSSLNEFKTVMKALNDPVAVPKHTNPEIIQLLTPSPTPEELNIYMIEMSERNGISLEEINVVGHHFSHDYKPPEQLALEKQIGEQFKNQFENQWRGQGQGGQGFNGQGNYPGGQSGFNGAGQGGFGGNQGGFGGNQGGFSGNQGGFGGGQGGFGGNQGGFGGNQGGGQGGFGGGQGGQGGYGGSNPYEKSPNNNVNPYQSGGQSNINVGPNFVDVGSVKKAENQKPRQFTSYEDIIGLKQDPNKGPIYPSIDPTQVNIKPYDSKGNIANPFERQSITNVNNHGQPSSTPTISQILRDFK